MGNFPLRHLSIRVPWHDSGWKGVICQAPHLNGACVKLKGITDKKNDEQECKIAGRSLDDLDAQDLPPCVNERGSFMASFELEPIKRHALAQPEPLKRRVQLDRFGCVGECHVRGGEGHLLPARVHA